MERCKNTDCPNFGDKWCWACQYYNPEEVPDPTPEPVWTRRQWDKVQQLQSEIEYYRKERAVLLLEANKARPKRKSKPPSLGIEE